MMGLLVIGMGGLFFIAVLAVIIVMVCVTINEYNNSAYYQITKKSFWQLRSDTGSYGEYLIYKRLKNYEQSGARFLFNCYLPKEDGQTTEIDVLMIDSNGIFVFESKNYSGWIFGSESSKMWTQTLPSGKGKSQKEHFLNPIIQNKGHLKWLAKKVGENIPLHSVIVFSERCTLKDISVTSQDVTVIKRDNIVNTVNRIGSKQIQKLSVNGINYLYNLLYPYTQMSAQQKQQHVNNIKMQQIQSNVKQVSQNVTANVVLAVQQDEVELICPKCKGKLVLRTAKRGENKGKKFYGCINYPQCKYIKNI